METVPEHDPSVFGEAQFRGDVGAMTVLSALDLVPDVDLSRPKPAVKRVFSGDGSNVILFNFGPGQRLLEHRAVHPIMVQCLRGQLSFGCAEQIVVMRPGTILHLDARVSHRVDCAEDAAASNVLQLVMLTGKKDS